MTSSVRTSVTDTIVAGDKAPLLVFSGPCQLESLDHSLMIADHLQKATKDLPVSLVFKASFDKANRTSGSSKRGVGLDEGLRMFQDIKDRTGLPVITDIHLPSQAATVAEVADVLQIPAFLCRQTDLIQAAAKTGKALHIKKGQFLHPLDMHHVAEKAAAAGNTNLLLCERGTMHGYRDLVVDFRSFSLMRSAGYPVVFDATHSVQSMGGAGGSSGGSREYIAPYVRAAMSYGVDGLFLECHQDPDNAPSDGPSMLRLPDVGPLLAQACALRAIATESA